MKRNYEIGEKTGITFFVGTEIEHTPAYGQKTLFVVGLQLPADMNIILYPEYTVDNKVTHIYFGANQSFDADGDISNYKWQVWTNMIQTMLDQGFWCTLDIDIKDVEGLLETGLCENNKFIPMISAKIPYLQQLGYNATLKIDDKDFAATNPGVWCHRIHDLIGVDKFTYWDQYSKDKILK